MHGRDIPVHAEILVLNGFSAHADRDELVAWAGSGPARPRDVFLVHGERGAQAQLRTLLERESYRVAVPERRDRYELGEQGWALVEG
jgi:metallo-beta-lactamase family protein